MVRLWDIDGRLIAIVDNHFRHVAAAVPTKANQHPVFKASAMETDFPVALTRKR